MNAELIEIGQQFAVRTDYSHSQQINVYRRIGHLCETRMIPVLVLSRTRYAKGTNGLVNMDNVMFNYEYSDNGKPMTLGYIDGCNPVMALV